MRLKDARRRQEVLQRYSKESRQKWINAGELDEIVELSLIHQHLFNTYEKDIAQRVFDRIFNEYEDDKMIDALGREQFEESLAQMRRGEFMPPLEVPEKYRR